MQHSFMKKYNSEVSAWCWCSRMPGYNLVDLCVYITTVTKNRAHIILLCNVGEVQTTHMYTRRLISTVLIYMYSAIR